MKVYVVANLKSAVYRTKYQDIDIVKGSVKITEQKTPWRQIGRASCRERV